MEYVRVAEDEQDQEPIELPVEEDGTILLSTVSGQFPGACGLKYRNPDTGSWRGLRLADERLQFPGGSWMDTIYVVVYPKGAISDNKRKGEESSGNPAGKTRRLDVKKNQDLVVLGLPWKTTEEELKSYFEQFGDVVFSELKIKYTTLEERLRKLESKSKRKETSEDDDVSRQRVMCTSRLNKQRLETSLEAFSHCTQQLHHQVEVLKSHKRQLGHLPASEITSLELSLSLLERCLHHLRSKEEEPSQPLSPPQVTPHQTVSDVKQAFNNGAGIGYPSSSGSYRIGDQSLFASFQNGDGGSMQALHISAKNASSVGTSQGSRPGSIDARESMYHFSPMDHNPEYDEDESWLEYDSSVDANATMAAKIKSLVANPKWGRLYYRNGASELTRSLAHILYTKEELILSTVTGRNGFEALDNVKLMAIREAVEKKYGHATSDFDQLWKQCVTSLGQHCKYLRQKSGISHSPQLVIKYDRDTRRSRGFGFVRFADAETSHQVMMKKHMIQGRTCEVKVPDSRPERSKLFVRSLSKDMTEQDLKDYFSEFGDVTEVYLPTPHRGFAFVTFEDGDLAQELKERDHVIKGHHVQLNDAEPKSKNRNQWGDASEGGGNFGGSSGGGGSGGFGGRGDGQYRDYRGRDFHDDRDRSNRGRGRYDGNSRDQGMGAMGNQLPMALAAALNQAGWGMLLAQGMQGQGGGHGHPNQGGGQNVAPTASTGSQQMGGNTDGLGGGYGSPHGMSWSQANQTGPTGDNSSFFGNQSKGGW